MQHTVRKAKAEEIGARELANMAYGAARGGMGGGMDSMGPIVLPPNVDGTAVDWTDPNFQRMMADMAITTFNCRFYDLPRMASDKLSVASN